MLVDSNRAAFEEEHRLFSIARNAQCTAREPLGRLAVLAALPEQEMTIGVAETCLLHWKAIAQ